MRSVRHIYVYIACVYVCCVYEQGKNNVVNFSSRCSVACGVRMRDSLILVWIQRKWGSWRLLMCRYDTPHSHTTSVEFLFWSHHFIYIWQKKTYTTHIIYTHGSHLWAQGIEISHMRNRAPSPSTDDASFIRCERCCRRRAASSKYDVFFLLHGRRLYIIRFLLLLLRLAATATILYYKYFSIFTCDATLFVRKISTNVRGLWIVFLYFARSMCARCGQ